MNLRQRAADDMKQLNIADWGLPVELTDPDGIKYTLDADTGETLQSVQILYDRRTLNLATGEETVIKEPIVVIARKSLSRIPVEGEIWHVRMPLDPDPDADLYDFIFSDVRSPEGGQSLGFIRLYLQRVVQSE